MKKRVKDGVIYFDNDENKEIEELKALVLELKDKLNKQESKIKKLEKVQSEIK